MKKWMTTVAMCLLMACVSQAGTVLPRAIIEPAEEPVAAFPGDEAVGETALDITGRTTYDDRTSWRGYPVMGANSTVMPGVSIGYGGFVADLCGYLPTDSGYELSKRMDLLLAYLGQVEGFEYNVGYGYYLYPEGSSPTSDNPNIQEAFVTLAYPVQDFRPRATMVYAWPDEDESDRESGAMYVAGVDWLPAPNWWVFGEIAYNDGLSPFAEDQAAESDWSYALFGVQYDIAVSDTLILRPGLYHQLIMEETHNPDGDQTWFSFGVVRKF